MHTKVTGPSKQLLAQCLASNCVDPGKFSMVFSVVFQASTGNKLREKIPEKIPGPGNMMLNIPLLCSAYGLTTLSKCRQNQSHILDP